MIRYGLFTGSLDSLDLLGFWRLSNDLRKAVL